MLWAQENGSKILASPGSRAKCPCCGGDVIAKCGEIVSWHWSHKQKDCDSWHEPESQWHINWKKQFPQDWQEIAIGNHRADIATPHGIIEFQNSPLNAAEIRAREDFYGRMIWVVNASDFKCNLETYIPESWRKEYIKLHQKPEWALSCGTLDLFGLLEQSEEDLRRWKKLDQQKARAFDEWIKRKQEKLLHFRWLWPRKTWLIAQRKVYLDFGDDKLYRIASSYGRKRTYIIAEPLKKSHFIERLITP